MHTPVTYRGLRLYDDMTPDGAAVRAWTSPGPNPEWHRKAQEAVRRAMPLVARALDRMADRDGCPDGG